MDLKMLKTMPVGVVGLGLMGSSIVVALLASGHRVIAVAPIPGERQKARDHIQGLLQHAAEAGIVRTGIEDCIDSLKLVEDYDQLSDCGIVLECVIEDKEVKESVYRQIADVVSHDTIIASNTSAIPISELQELVPHPSRFLGVHWAEPAYMTRFLEVTCGAATDAALGDLMVLLGENWGKEPTLLTKDIRGFITNRLMYAVYREALSLVEQSHTTLSDADKVFRYDVGSWVTMMGLFERMALGQHKDIVATLNRLFPELNNSEEVPAIMEKLVAEGGRGIHNLDGLYPYTESSAKKWEEAFARFNKDIYELAARYHEFKEKKSISGIRPAVRAV